MVAHSGERQPPKPMAAAKSLKLPLVTTEKDKKKKMKKKLRGNDLELTYHGMNQGCRVQIYAKNPNLLFSTFEGDTISMKEELEKICDD